MIDIIHMNCCLEIHNNLFLNNEKLCQFCDKLLIELCDKLQIRQETKSEKCCEKICIFSSKCKCGKYYCSFHKSIHYQRKSREFQRKITSWGYESNFFEKPILHPILNPILKIWMYPKI